jgi:NAD+ synthase
MKTEDEIIEWLKKYLIENKINCFVVGISGGIDSALVSLLCAKTGLKTILVSIPILQNKDHIIRAKKHYRSLSAYYKNVEIIELNLDDIFLDFSKKILDTLNNNQKREISDSNLKSRMRMCSLYYISSMNSGIVVGTGNKVEDFGIGFFTKYGDGGVDLSPIGDLSKTEVREMSRRMGIIKEILEAKPTDGLWEDDRSDEDQIGASYEELEWSMDFKGDVESLKGRELEVYKIYSKLNHQNLHKMAPIPVFKKNKNGDNNL